MATHGQLTAAECASRIPPSNLDAAVFQENAHMRVPDSSLLRPSCVQLAEEGRLATRQKA
jgi:hypothetical protein